MEQNLKVERLYSLGDYKNIKIISELNGIPDELHTRKEVVSLLLLELMLECESAYFDYKKLSRDTANIKELDDAAAYIDDLREKTLLNIITIINNEGD